MNWWFFRVSLLIAAVLCGSGGNNRPNQVDKSLVVLFTILKLEYYYVLLPTAAIALQFKRKTPK